MLHSTLVACSLYLLTGCISSQWQDLVQVVLAHPKVRFSPSDWFRLIVREIQGHKNCVVLDCHLLIFWLNPILKCSTWQGIYVRLIVRVILNSLLQIDIFMDAIFGAVHVSIMFLQIKLSEQHSDVCLHPHEQVVNFICQQCEASLQFLQSLCQQKVFRERLLRNKVSS